MANKPFRFQLKLSKPDSDRLLALAGLSKVMAHVTGMAVLSEDLKEKDKLGGETALLPRGKDTVLLYPHTTGGMITYDLEHGMLWYPEKLSSPPSLTRRIQDVPTLSWASVLRPVFFYDTRPPKDNRISYSETGFQEEAWLPEFGAEDGVAPAANRPIALNVDESVTAADTSYSWGMQTSHGRGMRMRVELKFHHKASLLPVHVGKPLTDAQELKRVMELTLYEALVDRCDWWTICRATQPHDTIGCAAFEGYYPALSPGQPPEPPEVRSGQQVYARPMYRQKRKIGSRVLGLGSRYENVYTVLFLKPGGEENEYLRVGIGRLFVTQGWAGIPPVHYSMV